MMRDDLFISVKMMGCSASAIGLWSGLSEGGQGSTNDHPEMTCTRR